MSKPSDPQSNAVPTETLRFAVVASGSTKRHAIKSSMICYVLTTAECDVETLSVLENQV